MDDFQKGIIRDTSIPLPGGGDSHIDPWGHNENDFVITTRIPIGDGLGSADIHDNPNDWESNKPSGY